MADVERILIAHHLDRGDHKVTLHAEMIAPVGTVYLMRFYNPHGSCYSSLDAVDDTGVVTEIDRRHRLDERKMVDSVVKEEKNK